MRPVVLPRPDRFRRGAGRASLCRISGLGGAGLRVGAVRVLGWGCRVVVCGVALVGEVAGDGLLDRAERVAALGEEGQPGSGVGAGALAVPVGAPGCPGGGGAGQLVFVGGCDRGEREHPEAGCAAEAVSSRAWAAEPW